MLSLDATTIRELAPAQNGQRAERQHEIIEGMGTSISATLDSYDINTPLRIAHFLAQVAHESDGFCTTEEYASGLAYEGRKDLGNLETNDGPPIQGAWPHPADRTRELQECRKQAGKGLGE